MPSIPEEICLDIILRLPVKSVLACKCVCKTWYSMISNHNFVKSHLNRSIQNNNYGLMILGYGEGRPSIANTIICSIRYDTLSNDIVESAIEFHYPFKSLSYDVVLMCCCNGLVCLWVKNMVGKRFFCLWNPCTKEYKEIPDSPNEDLEEDLGIFAFGYDSKIDDYKFFKVSQPDDDSALIDVYTVGSNSWRSIKDIPYSFLCEQCSGVLLNKGFHWFGSKDEDYSPVIISLDISNEIVKEMQFPEEPLENEQLLRCLGVLEGCLCVLFGGGYKVDVWVMKDYGLQESWTKHFSISYDLIWDCPFFSFIWSFENDKVLLYAGDDLVVYDPEHMSVRNPRIRILRSLGQVENHVESLVSLKSGTYARREMANCKRRAIKFWFSCF